MADSALKNIPPLTEPLIEVAVFGSAYGIRGGVHVLPHASDAGALLNNQHWWWRPAKLPQATSAAVAAAGLLDWQALQVRLAKRHGHGIVAEFVGIADRNIAEAMRGGHIALPRSAFPALTDDEFYWVDLIGLQVVNQQGKFLGTVVGMQENGVHALMQVEPTEEVQSTPIEAVPRSAKKKKLPELIPFVERHVLQVELSARRILVDWEW